MRYSVDGVEGVVRWSCKYRMEKWFSLSSPLMSFLVMLSRAACMFRSLPVRVSR